MTKVQFQLEATLTVLENFRKKIEKHKDAAIEHNISRALIQSTKIQSCLELSGNVFRDSKDEALNAIREILKWEE